jgi:hypothetical protein
MIVIAVIGIMALAIVATLVLTNSRDKDIERVLWIIFAICTIVVTLNQAA